MQYRWTAGLLATALSAGLLGMPAAHAGSKGRKNTTLALGGVAAYQLLKGKTTTGLAAGAGAAYAYKRYRDQRKEEKRRATVSGTYSRNGGPVYYNGSRSVNKHRSGRPVAWVEGRPIWTRDDYIDSRTGLRSADVPAPGAPPQRYDYGAAARAEAYRNSIYGQSEAALARSRGASHGQKTRYRHR